MNVTRNVFTIADLMKWLDEKTLIVNRDYQRGQGIWPPNARSYFIDTILNGYPFPKVTIRQTIDLRTRKSIREIIDGQQRLTTLQEFINNKMTITSVSRLFKGKKFEELNDEDKERILSYEVSVDTIIAATDEEVLEVFRRMNSYTLPLNDQEKRHAIYQGDFKWFIKEMIDNYSPMLEKYKILTVKQISRMSDADLMTELCQVLIDGVQARSSKKLDEIYKNNDKNFSNKNVLEQRLRNTLDFIKVDLNRICTSGVLKSYSFYSLFSALIFNRYGIVNIDSNDLDGTDTIGEYIIDLDKAIQNVMELSMAVDMEDDTGYFGEFVKASTATTHSYNNRLIRLKWLSKALQDKL